MSSAPGGFLRDQAATQTITDLMAEYILPRAHNSGAVSVPSKRIC
jgi:hypothetical protein